LHDEQVCVYFRSECLIGLDARGFRHMPPEVKREKDPNRIRWSVRRLNPILASYPTSKYLEIGVSKGHTFLGIVADHKVAVDPQFKLDVDGQRKPGVELFEVTSDEYFMGLPVQEKFDVVFLDGLHTFEQTYRDLLNALVHTHDRSAILIDDVFPNDVYSSLANQPRTRLFRQRAGVEGHGWHGDTFKVIFAIHDFMPSLCYRTLIGRGNIQTLIWRGKTQPRKPIYDNLELISRLTYFDMIDHEDAFFKTPEADAIAECLAAIRPAVTTAPAVPAA
jgi:hypothetical protein